MSATLFWVIFIWVVAAGAFAAGYEYGERAAEKRLG